MMEDLQYSIGRFRWAGTSTTEERATWIKIIAATPAALSDAVAGKLALTEDAPLIKGYSESAWAELPDARSGPVEPSLQLASLYAWHGLHHVTQITRLRAGSSWIRMGEQQ